MISYTRFQKEPPQPAQTIVKRSFKNFPQHDFLKDLSNIDWTPVYMMQDIDDAVAVFSQLYLTVLDVHAPWVKFQKRKNYVPWLSEKTKLLIKERDRLKKIAIKLEYNYNLMKLTLKSSQSLYDIMDTKPYFY